MEFKLKKLETVIEVSEIANVHFFEFPKSYKTNLDTHPFCELIFVSTGSILVESEKYSGIVNKNEFLIHGANSAHAFSCQEKAETTLIIIGFKCNSSKLACFEEKPVVLNEREIQQLGRIVKEGRNVFAPPYNVPVYDMTKKENQLFGSEQMLRASLETFLIELIRKYEFFERNVFQEETSFTIKEILDYIDENFKEKITLDELAFLFRTNRSTLCRKFQETTKQTLGEYVKAKKIAEAKKLLSRNDKTVTQIANELHFDTVSYFCEFFKKETGMTPSQFRACNNFPLE